MKNVILMDSDLNEAKDFVIGLEREIPEKWEVIVCNSNQSRKSKLYNIKRYTKYFLFPFSIFIKRKKYRNIIAWQQFYGVLFSFYCHLFNVEKTNKLTIMTFIYKEKHGIIGKIYEKFMNYALYGGRYVDVITCTAKAEMEMYSKKFRIPYDKFEFVPWGILDYAKDNEYDFEIPENKNGAFLFSPGRSNRDWKFLIDSLKEESYPLLIACDELRYEKQGSVTIDNTVDVKKSNELMAKCFAVVISIDDPLVSSGQTVLMQAMNYGKPIIITKSAGLSDDYITDHENGLVINKSKIELLSAINELYMDETLYRKLSTNGRKEFEEKYSKHSLGCNIGRAIKKRT